jgi:hypothetical protein
MLMNAKTIALTITFAAVAIALNVVRIPVVFYPGSFFQISQIPIVVVFLLYGASVGVLVGVINLVGGLLLFPLGPGGFMQYSMDFVSLLLMFAGLYVASRYIIRNDEAGRFSVGNKPVIILTALATTFRGGIMPIIDYGLVSHVLVPLFLGVTLPEAYIAGLVPAFVLYNVIVTLYTVPLAYVVATTVGRYLKIEPHFLRKVRELRVRFLIAFRITSM